MAASPPTPPSLLPTPHTSSCGRGEAGQSVVLCWRGSLLAGFSAGGVLVLAAGAGADSWCWRLALVLVPGAGAWRWCWFLVPGAGAWCLVLMGRAGIPPPLPSPVPSPPHSVPPPIPSPPPSSPHSVPPPIPSPPPSPPHSDRRCTRE
ncbi:unnamed protein product [Closterium sp. Naga37s-1]|nr:unnamed protein product [Closterium sp. Naga37s-1]